jgi:hypothetical protein
MNILVNFVFILGIAMKAITNPIDKDDVIILLDMIAVLKTNDINSDNIQQLLGILCIKIINFSKGRK